MNDINFYELLGVAPTASIKEIEIAFKSACKKYHPDLQGNNESSNKLFQYILRARDILLNPNEKRVYDEKQFGSPKRDFSFEKTLQLNNNSENKEGVLLFIGLLAGLLIGNELGASKKSVNKKLVKKGVGI